MTWIVHQDDCMVTMAAMPSASVDAVVCDPPAGVSFMGAGWDSARGGMDAWVEWLASRLREALRVAKPGAHALVWALPRTSHWTGLALEHSGWDVRDMVTHLFASGFPKHSGVLKPAAEVWWLARKPLAGTTVANVAAHGTGILNVDACRLAGGPSASIDRREAHARRTDGGDPRTRLDTYGSDGKDASANFVRERPAEQLGRWPAHVTFSHDERCVKVGTRQVKSDGQDDLEEHAMAGEEIAVWACVPGCPVRLLDNATAHLHMAGNTPASLRRAEAARHAGGLGFGWGYEGGPGRAYGDSGGASRFFFQAKASQAERNAGCDSLPVRDRDGQSTWGGLCNVCGCRRMLGGATTCGHDDFEWVATSPTRNRHPTVKSIALMRWLVRLITPPGHRTVWECAGCGYGSPLEPRETLADGAAESPRRPGGAEGDAGRECPSCGGTLTSGERSAVVLDPFAGTGSTGIAAVLDGFDFIGVEHEPEYVEVARARIRWWAEHPEGVEVVRALEADARRHRVAATGQLGLLDGEPA